MNNPLEKLDLGIGMLELYDCFAIGYINPNIDFSDSERKIFLDACLAHFREKPFGYISVRNNAYSINPIIYINLNKVENLKAFAIVAFSEIGKGNAKIEGQFFKNAFKIFDNKKEAIVWMKKTIENS